MATKLSDNTIAQLHFLQKITAASILIFTARLIGVFIFSSLVVKAEGSDSIQDTLSTIELRKLSPGDLTDIVVTSVSLRPEKISASPSAIQVVTDQDIRRSGASNISEALRSADRRVIISEPPQESVKEMK